MQDSIIFNRKCYKSVNGWFRYQEIDHLAKGAGVTCVTFMGRLYLQCGKRKNRETNNPNDQSCFVKLC